MKIAVNTRLLQKDKLEGIGWFSHEILKRIVINHPEHQFYFIFDRKYDDSFIFANNVFPVVVPPPTRHPVLYYIWFEFQIPRFLKKIKADIFLSPDGFLTLKTKIPQITVIHDICFVHYPNQLPFFNKKYNNYYFPKFAKIAKHILTVSQFSKNDISNTYNIDKDKITVCYNAAQSIYTPISDEIKIETKKKYSQGEDYFVFVGALHPRKNITGLLKSFDIFKKSGNYSQKLIVVGNLMHKTQDIFDTLANLKFRDDVIFTGRLNNENLHQVLASATALVYIPFFEGFGIPLVEAMSCEIPIISGNASSLPEIANEAALYTDADNHKKTADLMQQIVENKELRKNLIEKGKIQLKKFSWDKSAEIMWDCILKVYQENA